MSCYREADGPPEDEADCLACFIAAQGGKVDEQHLPVNMLGDSIGHHGLANSTGPMKQQHQTSRTPNYDARTMQDSGRVQLFVHLSVCSFKQRMPSPNVRYAQS